MRRFRPAAVLVALFITGWFLPVNAIDSAHSRLGTLEGIVFLDGIRPEPRKIIVKGEIQRLINKDTVEEQSWLVGKNQGLANCVITLREKDPAARVPARPLDRVVLEKRGAAFTHRIVIATPGTKLLLRNIDCPCVQVCLAGFYNNLNCSIPAGSEREVSLEKKPDVMPVGCSVHQHISAWLLVVDTPYFAISDGDGKFTLAGLPPGEYTLQFWHEVSGRKTAFTGPSHIKIGTGKTERVELRVTPPKPEDAKK